MFTKKTAGTLLDYLLVFLLIATSGIELFYINENWIALGLVFVSFVGYKRGVFTRIDKEFYLIIALFIGWEIFQFLFHGGLRLRPLFGTFGRLTFAYLVIKTTNYQFIKYFINLIFALSVISLFFYSLFYLSPPLIERLIDFGDTYFTPIKKEVGVYSFVKPNIILFSFHGFEYSPMRNSGPFWEPGAFAVFLSLALTFELILESKIFSKKSIVLIIAILTTLSTTGYLVLFIIIIYYFFLKGRTNIALIMIVPFLIYAALFFMNDLDFLSAKIETNIEIADETTGSRFGSALADFNQIKKHPILGYGRNISALYGTENPGIAITHRNNSITKVYVQWGALALLYLFYIYKGFSRICSLYRNEIKIPAYFVLLVLLLNAFSQSIYQYPFFYGLMFFPFINRRMYKHQLN